MQVDLTLAVNYVPACACLCKALLLIFLIGLIPPGQEVHGGFITIAAMLYVDRAFTRNIIFDANAILMAIFFANVHAAVRSSSERPAYWFFVWGMHVCWAGMCLTLVYEPAHVKWFLERRAQASKVVPIVFMLFMLVTTASLHTPLEPPPLRACRAMAFTLLSFTWIYVVGIHTQSSIEYLKETSSQFIVRLAPVLYSPPWLSGAFTVAAVVGLVLQYYNRFKPQEVSAGEGVQVVVQTSGESEYQALRPVETPEDIKTHELFRQAKNSLMSSKNGRAPGLESVPE